MKKYLVMLVVLAVATVVNAQTLTQGTREFIIGGSYDPEGSTGAELALEVGYGVFMRDGIEVGGILGYASIEDFGTTVVPGAGPQTYDYKWWSLSGFVEYHFQTAGLTVPYVGFEAGFVSYEAATDEDAFVYGPKAGIKYYIAQNVAVDVALKYMLASEDIFTNEGDVEDTDLSLTFGIRATF